MDYTQSPQNVTHGSTGQRMHSDTAVPTTRVTDKDLNALTWEIMEIIKWGVANGVVAAALPFDPNSPPTYNQLRQCIFGAIAQQLNAGSFLKLDGSTPMTGALTLAGNATAAQHAPNLAQVQGLIAALVNSAPATLDTLNELAAALGNDANFASATASALAGKVSAVNVAYSDINSATTGILQNVSLAASIVGGSLNLTLARTYSAGAGGVAVTDTVGGPCSP